MADPPSARPARGRRLLIAVVAGAVALSAAGMAASTLIKSPQQVVAEAGPPTPSKITAPVENRVLVETVIIRGQVKPRRTFKIKAQPVGSGDPVITSRPFRKGAWLNAGQLIAEVSGRPLIALEGRIPAYRDLHRGNVGPDVEQLQRALRAVGYPVHDRSGAFGRSTEAAVTGLYRARGYRPRTEEVTRTPDTVGDGGDPDGKREAKTFRRVIVPKGELVFVPEIPGRVTKVRARVGEQATGVIAELALGDLRARGRLSPAERDLVEEGTKVEILDERSGKKTAGQMASIGGFREGSEDAPPGHPITVTGDIPRRLNGKDVRLTIHVEATDEPVLAVPASAIFSTADGEVHVVRVRNGREIRVTVTTGASAEGFVEVRGGDLEEGDKVVIGQ